VIAAVAFILLGIPLVAVSYANPEFIENHPDVDLDNEPEEVAHDALMNLSARDYTLTQRFRRWNETTESWETWPFFRYEVDNTNERYSIWIHGMEQRTSERYEPIDGFYPALYANEGTSWSYKGELLIRDLTYAEEIANPDIDAKASDWRVHEENKTHLVLRAESPENLSYGEIVQPNGFFDDESYVDVYVDRQERRVSKVIVKEVDVSLLSEMGFGPAEEGEIGSENIDEFDFSNFSVYHTYHIYDLHDFGETSVERPKEAPEFSINEVLLRIVSEHRRR